MLPFYVRWRYRKFHPSYLIAWGAFGVLIGLLVGREVGLGLSSWFCLLAVVPAVAALRRGRWWSVVAICLLGCLVGMVRGSDFAYDVSRYGEYIGRKVTIRGDVLDDPQYGDRSDKKFLLGNVTVDGVAMPGAVAAGTFSIQDIRRGDGVTLSGKLGKGYGSYQASLGFANLVGVEKRPNPLREFRDSFAAGVRNAIGEPMASLGVGFVVGQRSALPDDLDDDLRAVGLTHIVVASGYNLTILVRFARRVLAKRSKYVATVAAASMMAGFVMVSGLSPSMTRAALVGSLSLLAWYYGRVFHPVILLLLAGSVTAFAYPVYVWGDVGWYLSFFAFAGVMLIGPLIGRMLWGAREPRPLVSVVLETVSAEMMTLPIILTVFGYAPLVGLLSNVLVGPFIPLAMLLTTVAGVAGWILPSLSGWVGAPGQLLLWYVVSIVHALASLKLTYSWQMPMLVAVAMYVVVACVAAVMWRRLGFDFRARSLVE